VQPPASIPSLYIQHIARHGAHQKGASVVKGIILQMKHDILDQRHEDLRRELKELLPLAC
jgi:hypothetical protein